MRPPSFNESAFLTEIQNRRHSLTVKLKEMGNGKLLEMHLTGKLVKGDYEESLPAIERLIKQHGKLRILVDMTGLHGWTGAALWEDIKFDMKHFNDIERVAIVGDKKWVQWMATFSKPFTMATIRYFDLAISDKARDWLAMT